MKIGIVGSGLVGSTAAYALVLNGIGREIVLVDKFAERAIAEADDIRHAVPFAHAITVRAGDYPDLAGCRVVVVCAGVNQKPGETRLQLLARNAAVFREVIPSILAHAADAVIIVATNPVDVMTHLASQIAGAVGRVFGTGTTLDTARFRTLLGAFCGVDPHHIHGYVLGEHGDSEVLAWSSIAVGGMPLPAFLQLRNLDLSAAVRDDIDGKVRRAAYTIIRGKGATYYGIGAAIARIVDALLHDQRSVLTVCAPAADVLGVRDVTLALPRLVGGAGVMETFPLPLDPGEQTALARSATVIRAALDELSRA
jgi:L-lactate dehydrogenase